jgi:hypothetical protein
MRGTGLRADKDASFAAVEDAVVTQSTMARAADLVSVGIIVFALAGSG